MKPIKRPVYRQSGGIFHKLYPDGSCLIVQGANLFTSGEIKKSHSVNAASIRAYRSCTVSEFTAVYRAVRKSTRA